MKTNSNIKSAFTLIELMIVIAIVGILSAMAIVALGSARQKANDVRVLADVAQARKILEMEKIDTDNYGNLSCTAGVCASLSGTTNKTSIAALAQDVKKLNGNADAFSITATKDSYAISAPITSKSGQSTLTTNTAGTTNMSSDDAVAAQDLLQIAADFNTYKSTYYAYPTKSCSYSVSLKCSGIKSSDITGVGDEIGSLYTQIDALANNVGSLGAVIYMGSNSTSWTSSSLFPSARKAGKNIWTGNNFCISSAGKLRVCTSYPYGGSASSLCPDSGNYPTPPYTPAQVATGKVNYPFTCTDL